MSQYDDYKTLRDEIAIEAMKSLYRTIDAENLSVSDEALKSDCRIFYRIADAMLEARK